MIAYKRHVLRKNSWVNGTRVITYYWYDQSKWDYTNWKSGQPDNFGYIPYSPLDSSEFESICH